MMPTVTVVIPHIPVRTASLGRALKSVIEQTRYPDAIHIEADLDHMGSAHTRNRAITCVRTKWIAWLDDDDELLPHHLDELVRCAEAHEADVVYPGCTVIGGHDPHDRFGQPFDPDLLRQKSYIPVTSLCRTSLVKEVLYTREGFVPPAGCDYDDWGFYLAMLDAGAEFVHHPVKTWLWHHYGVGRPGVAGNTSGRGDRW